MAEAAAKWEDAPAAGADKWEEAPEKVPSPFKDFMSQAGATVAAIPHDIAEEFRAGKADVNQSLQNMREKTASGDVGSDVPDLLQYLGGGMRELFSPITGTAKAVVGDPIRKNTKGIPYVEPVGEFVAKTGEEAASMFGPAGVERAVGAVAKAFPDYNKAVKTLLDSGVSLTPGQIMQGMMRNAESTFSGWPVIGGVIKSGQRRSFESFNEAVINRSLEKIGEKLPEKIAPGRDSIRWAEEKIGEKYDALLPQLTFVADNQFGVDVADMIARSKTMPVAQQEQLQAFLDDLAARLGQRGNAPMTADGQTFKNMESELGFEARRYLRSPNPGEQALGEKLTELRGFAREALERANPNHQDELQTLNSAWAAFARAQGASIRRVKSQGVFSPADLLQDIRSSTTRGVFARGDGLLQDIADAAERVLPSSVPDSGTAGRLGMWDLLVGGGMATVKPEALVGAAGVAAPYTKPGMAVVNKAARKAPTLKNLTGAGTPKTGAAAAISGMQDQDQE